MPKSILLKSCWEYLDISIPSLRSLKCMTKLFLGTFRSNKQKQEHIKKLDPKVHREEELFRAFWVWEFTNLPFINQSRVQHVIYLST